ncbi:MAG TPA: SRPBCC family protein [Burkholderiaceae bacterium]
MKFEHLIEINDIMNPLLDQLTREQLWAGLVLRAESPKLFVPHLDDSEISARTATSMQRKLRYGDLVVQDTVTLDPMDSLTFDVSAQENILASSLVMTIEEPGNGNLYVRFAYDDGADAASDAANEMYNDFKRSAYVEADIDTIRIIREMADQGRLGASLN